MSRTYTYQDGSVAHSARRARALKRRMERRHHVRRRGDLIYVSWPERQHGYATSCELAQAYGRLP